jgi:hypothetical protein
MPIAGLSLHLYCFHHLLSPFHPLSSQFPPPFSTACCPFACSCTRFSLYLDYFYHPSSLLPLPVIAICSAVSSPMRSLLHCFHDISSLLPSPLSPPPPPATVHPFHARFNHFFHHFHDLSSLPPPVIAIRSPILPPMSSPPHRFHCVYYLYPPACTSCLPTSICRLPILPPNRSSVYLSIVRLSLRLSFRLSPHLHKLYASMP